MIDIIDQLENAMDDPGDTGWAQSMRTSLVEQAIAEIGRLRVIEADQIRQCKNQETARDAGPDTATLHERTSNMDAKELVEIDTPESLTLLVANICEQHQRARGALESARQILFPDVPTTAEPPKKTNGLMDALREARVQAGRIADEAEALRDGL